MKKGQVAIFIIVGIFLVGAILLLVWLWGGRQIDTEDIECSKAEDCVPRDCCDSNLCVPVRSAPDCRGVECAPGCASFDGNFLGCMQREGGAGSCGCIEGKCAPVWP